MGSTTAVQSDRPTGISASQVKYAAGMATAALTSYVLSNALHLSGSYWSVLSAVIVFRFDFGHALGASRDRMLGTVAGAVLAVGLLALTRLWNIPGLLLLAAMIFPLSFLAAVRPQYRTSLVTSIIVLSASGGVTKPLAAAIGRLLAVGLGAFIGGLFSFVLSLTKHPGVGHEPAAKIISGLGVLLPVSCKPEDNGKAARLRHDIYSGLCRFSSATERLPEAKPIVRTLTRLYWDVVFIGRLILTESSLEENPGLQTTLARVSASFRRLCVQAAESLRQAKPLPTLVDFDEACCYLPSSGDHPTWPVREGGAVVSLLHLLREDFENLMVILAGPPKGDVKPGR